MPNAELCSALAGDARRAITQATPQQAVAYVLRDVDDAMRRAISLLAAGISMILVASVRYEFLCFRRHLMIARFSLCRILSRSAAPLVGRPPHFLADGRRQELRCGFLRPYNRQAISRDAHARRSMPLRCRFVTLRLWR